MFYKFLGIIKIVKKNGYNQNLCLVKLNTVWYTEFLIRSPIRVNNVAIDQLDDKSGCQ